MVTRHLQDVTAIVVDRDAEDSVLPAPARPAGVAVVLTTSGSMGRPVDVELSERSLVALLEGLRIRTGVDERDRFVAHTSPTFVNALRESLLPLSIGASVVVLDDDTAQDPRRLGEVIDRGGASILSATPTMLRALLATGWSGPSVRAVWAGGEPFALDLARRLMIDGRSVWNSYGSTEAPTAAMQLVDPGGTGAAVAPVGAPLGGVSLRVMDEAGQPLPFGVPGELCVGGRAVEELTDSTRTALQSRLVDDPVRRGEQVLRTGDRASVRPDGLVELQGRLDRTVQVRGVRLSLDEVEVALGAHPSVVAAVASVERGPGDFDRLVAQVEFGPDDVGVTTQELRDVLRTSVAGHLIPSVITRVDHVPRTGSGKSSVSQTDVTAVDAASSEPPEGELEELIAATFAAVLGRAEVGRHDDFFALGGHSLMAVEAFVELESRLGRRLQLSMLAAAPTVAELADRIESWSPPAGSSLVPVNVGGDRTPFFYVSPLPRHGAECREHRVAPSA